MIPIEAEGIKLIVGLGAAAPAFRFLASFAWEIAMDRARAKTYDYVKGKTGYLIKDKIGFAMENNVYHLSIKVRGHEFKIHHPYRDKTHERYTLLTHYMHPERFSPLLQEKVEAKTLAVIAKQTEIISLRKIQDRRVVERKPIIMYG